MRPLLLFCSLLLTNVLLAQSVSDTVQLREVETVAKRPGFTEIGKKRQSLDSLVLMSYQGKHLGDLIGAESAVSLKTYGVNGIVGAAMRGTSSDHTAVIWNGVNLQSPTHGQFDLSLLPVFFTDKVSIEPGAGTGAYGSGAVGGAVVLGNTIDRRSVFGGKLYLAAGSYGNRQIGAGASFTAGKLFSDTRIFHHTAVNDYEIRKFYLSGNNKYYLLDKPYKQTHSNFLQQGAMQQLNYRFNEKLQLSNIFLYTNTDRLLTNSNGRQLDDDIRNVSTLNYRSGGLDLLATFGLQREIINYSDTLSKINSHSYSLSGWLQFGGKYKLNEAHTIYGYANPQLITANVDGYGDSKPTQRRVSTWAGINSSWLNKRLTTDLSLKQQWINGRSLPLIPSVGANYSVLEQLIVKAHTASVFHAPDFNDLYWAAGGNPNLLSESGWSHELGLYTPFKNFSAELTIFQNQVKNLIVWLPGNPYWSPINVREVRSKGVELNLKGSRQLGLIKLSADLSYSYTSSITTKSNKSDDPSLGKQQLFIPKHNGSARINAVYRTWSLGIHSHYTGIRYVGSDNLSWLPAYLITDIRLNKTLKLKTAALGIFVALNNLEDRFYMTMSGYPMPGRNFETGITLNFNK